MRAFKIPPWVLFLILQLTALAAWSGEPPVFLARILTQTLQNKEFNQTYVRDGCFIRAHWLAAEIHNSKRQPSKVFIEPQNRGRKLKVTLANQKIYEWVFHVAAAFKSSGSGEVWVLDPVLSPQVMSLADWKNTIQKQNPGMSFDLRITGPEVYHVHPEANADWAHISRKGPFSQEAIDYIRDAMDELFHWETFEN